MPKFSRSSNEILDSCSEELQVLFNEVVKEVDCSAISGFRDKEEQNRLYREGKSKVPFPMSKHNRYPSKALDVVPYPELYEDHEKFYWFAGFVWATARRLTMPIRWGGDWNGNMDLKDQNFYDLAHWELLRI